MARWQCHFVINMCVSVLLLFAKLCPIVCCTCPPPLRYCPPFSPACTAVCDKGRQELTASTLTSNALCLVSFTITASCPPGLACMVQHGQPTQRQLLLQVEWGQPLHASLLLAAS